MNIRKCFNRKILNPCNLKLFNYQVDSYIGCEHFCCYCYALNTAETDWKKEILIHGDLIEQLSREISSLEPQTIYIGMNSDPYQPSEKNLNQTRKVLELFANSGFSVCILTKSGLVTRDIDILTKMPGSSVGVSIAFQIEQHRQLFENHASSNKNRLEALENLKNAGIETYTLICPVMPYITNVESVIELVAPYSDTIWIYNLQIKSDDDFNWQNLQSVLNTHFPELTDRYRKIAFSRTHPYWKKLRKNLEELQHKKHLNLRIEL